MSKPVPIEKEPPAISALRANRRAANLSERRKLWTTNKSNQTNRIRAIRIIRGSKFSLFPRCSPRRGGAGLPLVLAYVLLLVAFVVTALQASVANGDEPLVLFFSGTLEPLNVTLTNPYTGEVESINGTFNVSHSVWQGGGSDQDFLILTSLSDALMLTDGLGQQMIMDIEGFSGGSEDDLILLADAIDYAVDTNISGNSGNDLIWANIGNDHISGGSGNDTINGGPGNDTVFGGSGFDKLNGASGIDELHGDTNNDILYFSVDNTWSQVEASRNVRIVTHNIGDPAAPIADSPRVSLTNFNQSHDLFHGGDGTDVLSLTEGNDAVFLHDPYSPFGGDPNAARIVDIEFIDAKGGDDIVDLTSTSLSHGDVTILGGTGNDVLWSSAGNDELFGGDGNDLMDGNSGHDTLQGGDGDDILYGRSGSDIMDGQSGSNIIYMGEDVDLVFVGEGNDTLIYDTFDALTDVIGGFEISGAGKDVLDLSNILIDYDPLSDVVGDFVAMGNNGGNATLLVNPAGDVGGAFTEIAVFNNLFTLADLLNADSLLLELAVEELFDSDFDHDGDVDGADFLAWQRGFGTPTNAILADGDATGDGVVDGADQGVFQSQFGTVLIHGFPDSPATSSQQSLIPEPTSLILFGMIALSVAIRRVRSFIFR